MLKWTRNGMVILLLIGVLLEDATRVEGLKCYDCLECTSEELKEKELDCPVPVKLGKNIQACTKSTELEKHKAGDKKAYRGCGAFSEADLEKNNMQKNTCKEVTERSTTYYSCLCDTDLCNGGNATRTSSTLVALLALIYSLFAISNITGKFY